MGMVLVCAAASQTACGKVAGEISPKSAGCWATVQLRSQEPSDRLRWLTGPATSPGSGSGYNKSVGKHRGVQRDAIRSFPRAARQRRMISS
jgi:hypothetical protein